MGRLRDRPSASKRHDLSTKVEIDIALPHSFVRLWLLSRRCQPGAIKLFPFPPTIPSIPRR